MVSNGMIEDATALLELYFDPAYYTRMYRDVADAKVNPLSHYMRSGHKQGRDPVRWFSTKAYRAEQNLSLEENPFLHFLRHHRSKADELRKVDEGALPVPGPTMAASKSPITTDVALALLNLYFDPAYYTRTYHDVAAAKVDPLSHYMRSGHKQGRDPVRWFSTKAYRAEQNLSLEENPFLHFLRHHRSKADELCKADKVSVPVPESGTSKSKPRIMTDVATALLKLYFDPVYYTRTYHDVAAAKVDPLSHYMRSGHKQGRDPVRWFSTKAYRAEQNLSLEENPFLHFLRNHRSKADELRKADKAAFPASESVTAKPKPIMQPYYALQLPEPPVSGPVVFTCIAGTRHALPNNTTQHFDQRLFADTPTVQNGWTFTPSLYWDENPKIVTLFHKYVMATFFPIGTRLIWIDSRVSLQVNIIDKISRLLDEADICAFSHYKRDCIYEELAAILTARRATLAQCEDCERYLRSINFPKNAGMFETGALGFKVTDETRTAMRQVFGLCKKYIPRDQVALPVVLRKSNIKFVRVNQGKTHLRNTPGVFVHSW